MELATLPQLTRDLRNAAATMGVGEARTLVDLYYGLQDFRIQANNQSIALTKSEEPHETIAFFHGQFFQLEKDIQKALDAYSKSKPLGVWAREHVGVGPVIAAGLLAHIDVTKTTSASSVWKYAGLVQGQGYAKGVKRDWNADVKLLAWKLGDSFVKQRRRDNCYYGHLYDRRKQLEVARNEAVIVLGPGSKVSSDEMETKDGVLIENMVFAGGNCKAAAQTLIEKNIRDTALKAILLAGKLPPGQLDQRARRYAVKRFLLHYWEAAWWLEFGTEPPESYVHAQLGHVDKEPCPIPMPKP